MNGTMHGSVSYLIYNLIHWIWFKTAPPPAACFFAFLFGMFPDFDGIIFSIKQGDAKHDTQFQHHLNSWFHWPIRWSPLIVIFLITLILDFYPQYFLIPTLGIYLHLIFDSAGCGDGMMWGHGWNREQFARYINLFSSKTDGYHGNYWGARYKKTIFYKMENVFAVIVVVLSIYYLIAIHGLNAWDIVVIGFVVILVITTALGPADKYKKEPPEGRYADYRKNEEYLAWMKEHGYKFNDNYQPVKN